MPPKRRKPLKPPKRRDNNSDPSVPPDLKKIEATLEDVKRLLMLYLLRLGVNQREMAIALTVDQSVISRTLPNLGRRVLTLQTREVKKDE